MLLKSHSGISYFDKSAGALDSPQRLLISAIHVRQCLVDKYCKEQMLVRLAREVYDSDALERMPGWRLTIENPRPAQRIGREMRAI